MIAGNTAGLRGAGITNTRAMSETNTKRPASEDFLEEDPEINSQKYVLLSFVSPENILTRKDNFFFQKFLADYEIKWKTKNLESYLAQQVLDINKKLDERANKLDTDGQNELATYMRESHLVVDDLIRSFAGYVAKTAKEIKTTTIAEDYADFMYRNQNKLEDEFHAANDFHTTVRGIKVRGVYPTTKEAEVRAKKLQRSDPLHNIFIGEVGKWLPWDPSPHQIAEQEYAEEQLNQLMKKYKENDDAKEEFYKANKLQRPAKTVFGGDAGSPEDDGSAANTFEGMFGAAGDLAIQRKAAAAAAENAKKPVMEVVQEVSETTTTTA